MIQRYGVPLDSRTRLTKADWCLWIATLADDRRDFEAIVSPIYDYLNETTGAAAVRRFLYHGQSRERRDACPPGDRRRFHQDARGCRNLEEMVEPRPGEARRLCPRADRRRASPKSSQPQQRQPATWRYTV